MKHRAKYTDGVMVPSPPAWGAWIETATLSKRLARSRVAPRVGGVD